MERENAPLLGSTGQSNGQDPPRNPHPIRDMFWPEFSPSFKYCIALELLCELAVMVITVPMVSVLERGVCLRYYPHGGIPGPEHCKILPIQQTLAEIRGWMASFETLAAILVALPLGRIVDHRGHRRLFMVIVTGMLLSLTWTLIIANNLAIPIKWVWASSFFLLIGGGRYAAEMLLAVMIAKACTEENRTQGLYQFYSCFIFSELVAPAISSVTSYISSSLPFVISYILLFSAFPLLLMMPQGDASSSVTTAMNPGRNQHVRDGQESRRFLHTFAHASVDQYRLLKFVFSSRNMRLAVAIFLVGTLRSISLRVLIQYASARFGWKLAATGGLTSEVALVNLFLFFIIMPALIRFITQRFRPSAETLNLDIVKGSLSLLLIGSLLVAFATNSALLIAATMVYALGFGARSTLLSLVTSWIEPQRMGTLYSAVFLVEQIGMLGGEPLVQNWLGISIGLQDPWKGLPFLGIGVFYVISLICAFAIRPS